MAVVYKNDCGWMLDQELWFKRTYKTIKMRNLPDLFNITDVFKMESQYKAEERRKSSEKESVKRKRKRKANNFDDNPGSFQSITVSEIKERYEKIVNEGRKAGFFEKTLKSDCNKNARMAAQIEGFGTSLQEFVPASDLIENQSQICVNNGDVLSSKTLGWSVVKNVQDCAIIVNIFGNKCVIPEKAEFLLSDFVEINKLKFLEKFDAIVIDPPWINKWIKRKKTYKMLNEADFMNIPVSDMASDNGCLVVVWATNKQKQIDMIKSELFPHWGVDFLADWHWLKVTKSGFPVYEINSQQKRPFENVIIGFKRTHPNQEVPTIDNHKLIVSIPCCIHSYKPPLNEILGPYLPANPRCCELFARSLVPHWFSWGNEVIKHQHEDYFEGLEENV